MKMIALFFLTVAFTVPCHAGPLIEEAWFTNFPPAFIKADYIDLNTNTTDRLCIRYMPKADRGVELERTTNKVVVWRVHVQPLNVMHSAYRHEVHVQIEKDNILVTSIGRQQIMGATQIFEVHSLKTGAFISRKVEDVQ